MKKKFFVFLAALLCLVLFQTASFADGNEAAYLLSNYDITFDGNVSADEFNAV